MPLYKPGFFSSEFYIPCINYWTFISNLDLFDSYLYSLYLYCNAKEREKNKPSLIIYFHIFIKEQGPILHVSTHSDIKDMRNSQNATYRWTVLMPTLKYIHECFTNLDNLVGKQGGCYMKSLIKIHTYLSIKHTCYNRILTIHYKRC